MIWTSCGTIKNFNLIADRSYELCNRKQNQDDYPVWAQTSQMLQWRFFHLTFFTPRVLLFAASIRFLWIGTAHISTDSVEVGYLIYSISKLEIAVLLSCNLTYGMTKKVWYYKLSHNDSSCLWLWPNNTILHTFILHILLASTLFSIPMLIPWYP